MITILLTIAVLGSTILLKTTDGCGKRPSLDLVNPTLTPVNFTEEVTFPTHHRLVCNRSEERITACMNGGKCYAIRVIGQRDLSCHCPKEFIGRRCEMKNFVPGSVVDKRKVKTANIVAGVIVPVLTLIVIIGAVYVYIRVKRKEKKQRTRNRQNGHGNNHTMEEMKPINTDKENSMPPVDAS